VLIVQQLTAQQAFEETAPGKYRILFADKDNSQFSLDNPGEFLSERAIQRRQKQGIPIDWTDLPVTQAYLDSVNDAGAYIVNVSRWFNAATIQTDDLEVLERISRFPFIKNAASWNPYSYFNQRKYNLKYKLEISSYYEEGRLISPSLQLDIHNSNILHLNNYNGYGIQIAVVKGQLIARLNQTEINASVMQAKLALEKAQRDYDRLRNLQLDSVVSMQQFQDAETALEIARQVNAIADFNLKHSEIISPANGIILRKMASKDEIIGSGMPVVYFGSMESPWIMNISVADRDVIRLKTGDSALIRMDAFPETDFIAFISRISSMADPYTGTFDVELNIQSETKQLISGLTGSAVIYPSTKSWYFIIPTDALIYGEHLDAEVYMVRNSRAERLSLKVEAIRNDMIYTKVENADSLEIIVSGLQFVSENLNVKTVTP